jgi:hypothetical protein
MPGPGAPVEPVPAPKEQPKKMPTTIGGISPVVPLTPVAAPRISIERSPF